jgi:hypothetical protein
MLAEIDTVQAFAALAAGDDWALALTGVLGSPIVNPSSAEPSSEAGSLFTVEHCLRCSQLGRKPEGMMWLVRPYC